MSIVLRHGSVILPEEFQDLIDQLSSDPYFRQLYEARNGRSKSLDMTNHGNGGQEETQKKQKRYRNEEFQNYPPQKKTSNNAAEDLKENWKKTLSIQNTGNEFQIRKRGRYQISDQPGEMSYERMRNYVNDQSVVQNRRGNISTNQTRDIEIQKQNTNNNHQVNNNPVMLNNSNITMTPSSCVRSNCSNSVPPCSINTNSMPISNANIMQSNTLHNNNMITPCNNFFSPSIIPTTNNLLANNQNNNINYNSIAPLDTKKNYLMNKITSNISLNNTTNNTTNNSNHHITTQNSTFHLNPINYEQINTFTNKSYATPSRFSQNQLFSYNQQVPSSQSYCESFSYSDYSSSSLQSTLTLPPHPIVPAPYSFTDSTDPSSSFDLPLFAPSYNPNNINNNNINISNNLNNNINNNSNERRIITQDSPTYSNTSPVYPPNNSFPSVLRSSSDPFPHSSDPSSQISPPSHPITSLPISLPINPPLVPSSSFPPVPSSSSLSNNINENLSSLSAHLNSQSSHSSHSSHSNDSFPAHDESYLTPSDPFSPCSSFPTSTTEQADLSSIDDPYNLHSFISSAISQHHDHHHHHLDSFSPPSSPHTSLSAISPILLSNPPSRSPSSNRRHSISHFPLHSGDRLSPTPSSHPIRNNHHNDESKFTKWTNVTASVTQKYSKQDFLSHSDPQSSLKDVKYLMGKWKCPGRSV